MLLALAKGNWAEWVGGIGTALAFGATSLVIWQGHRLRRIEHSEAMFDRALRVTADVGQGAEYLEEVTADGATQMVPHTKVVVTVRNNSGRQVTNVAILASTLQGERLGIGQMPFLQANWKREWMFDPIGDVWGKFGSSPGINAVVNLEFEDIDGTKWELTPDGHLLRFPRVPFSWLPRREGRRHSKHPRKRP